MAKHTILGKKGEAIAREFLIKKGYKIRVENYRFSKAEIDIIAQKNQTLVVVEVKTRSSNHFGNPQDFVHPKQIKRLVKAIDNYVLTEALDLEIRFDIIAILKTAEGFQIDHLKDAFYHF